MERHGGKSSLLILLILNNFTNTTIMNRRNFIEKTALGAGAISIFPQHVMGHGRSFAPSDSINLGFIGIGKQAMGLLN